MWKVRPPDEPEPELGQEDKSTQTPDLSSTWGPVTSPYADDKAIHDELERLRQGLKTANENAEVRYKGRLFAEEQSRQRGKLLENTIQEANAARKENRILMTKIASLQAGAETLSDEEAKREMSLLYHDLEYWRFTHFTAKPSAEQRNDPTPRPESPDILTLDIIQSDIAGLIYGSFWNRFMVGAEHPRSDYLRTADSEVNKRCKRPEKDHYYHCFLTPEVSNHIYRHWRCAMSTVMLSMETHGLQEQCNWIIEQVEFCFGRYAVTDKLKRMRQLHDIIARCITLKHRLECQKDTYIFWSSHQFGPFRDENMRTLIEEDDSDGLVGSSLWPALWKIIQPGKWSIVEKEIVKKIPPLIPSIEMIDEMESHQGDTDLDEL
ncbi:hypothetical protein N7447_007072 [Penicillium robsamsonii]|uniref:uncharacterized protein n=1 Tax=Penicillium robsamsonii TaxID=1792511 RepID=UPI0025470B1C|nr:uncharacterized protein N7447_007072 [Penicillium robsamsonii]KAJ5824732.1 hypothetical protein N7447_007072 [Penicillium robsamsonii]